MKRDVLLTTKLNIPGGGAGRSLVARPRLIERLDQGLERKLTLVSAPAGFGKTTLLSDWIRSRGYEAGSKENISGPSSPTAYSLFLTSRTAWLSLDEADNDPARLLSYLVATLRTLRPGVGEATLAVLQNQAAASAHQPAWIETALATLINEISANFADDVVLVLDDYHLIQTPAIHEGLAFLLDYLPPPLHLVIATRADPPLPLARLRARRQLLELRAADLRFTPAEAATFLNEAMGLSLAPADIAALDERTEGWIAGLQIAALSMKERADVAGFIAGFSGSHRHIFDYLAEEVLAQQPEPVQAFLLQTSILNRLTAPLCDALINGKKLTNLPISHPPTLPTSTSQSTLEYLEQANLFIIPLDDERRWYRYHHLFAEFLRERLRQQVGVVGVTGLHRRAAEWYEQNDLTAEATGHALAVADVERAVRLIEQSGSAIIQRSEMSTLLSWLETLPAEVIRARPRLSLFNAWALVLTGQLEAAEIYLQQVESGSEEEDGGENIPGELTAIQGTLAYFQQDIPQAIQRYRQALAELPRENLFLRGAVAMSLATVYHRRGELSKAKEHFAQAREIAEAKEDFYTVVVAGLNQAYLHTEQAELHQAATCYRQMLQLTGKLPAQEIPHLIGRVYGGLAGVLYQWNQLDEAVEAVRQGIRLGEQRNNPITMMSGYLILANLLQAQGELAGAMEVLVQAEVFGQKHDLSGWQVLRLVRQARLQLKLAEVESAARSIRQAQTALKGEISDDSAGYLNDLERLVQLGQARVLLAQHRPGHALDLLAELRRQAEIEVRTGRLIEILLLQAMAHQARDELDLARRDLERALALAEPGEYVRLFLDEGQAVSKLLGLTTSAYAQKLLVAGETDSQRRSPSRRLRAGAGEKRQSSYPGTTTRIDLPISQSPTLPIPQSPTLPISQSPLLLDPLSERELEILQVIDEGLSNQQIADRLFLTVGTVKWHINNIYSKLGVRRRTQALARARELNLL